MAIELITGRAGKAHIGSEDDRAYHAYTNGEGRYILNGGTADIESANNVHINPVEFLVDGAHVRVTGTGEDVAIENGVASYKRVDVIALHYTRTGGEDDYIESVEFAVVKGANVELGSTPQVPNMPKSGTILTGADDVYVPVYSLLIDGLTPKNITRLIEKYALPVAYGGTGAASASAAVSHFGLNAKLLYKSGNWHIYKIGLLMFVHAQGVTTSGGAWDATKCPYTIPSEYRPSSAVYAPTMTQNGGSWTGYVNVDSTGGVFVANGGNSGSTGARFGTVVYPIGY